MRLIDAEKLKFSGATSVDDEGEIMVSLADVRKMIAQAPTEKAVLLPAVTGDTMFYINSAGEIKKCTVEAVSLTMATENPYGCFWLLPSAIGKSAFLTVEDAEKYLKGEGK